MSTNLIKGIVASPGIRIGKAYVYHGNKIFIPKYLIKDTEVEKELNRLSEAVEKTKQDIIGIQKQIATSLSKDLSDIFTSHLMVLEDPMIIIRAKNTIIEKKRNVEWVINDISIELINSLSTIEDEYLRERIIDISDINKRLISNLQKTESSSIADITEEVIVFASDLTPSDTAMMNKEYILAFVTDKGGKTSHTAIMARALEIPAIVGSINGTSLVKNGDTVIVDAIHGNVLINPTESELTEFQRYHDDYLELEKELEKLVSLPSLTVDGEEVFIYGNIEIPEEMSAISNHGAQGIGLFRSEFLFLDKSLPDEEKQFLEYKKVVEHFKPNPVTIRTLDVGGDKIYSYTKEYKERNPFLGCRAIRFSLEHEKLFRTQLRAILRASAFGNVKLMYPMVSTVEEFIRAKAITVEIMKELEHEKTDFDRDIEIGLMIEVPSAVVISDILARHADFFSVGTNDLVQYTLAVDRINEKIAYLYNPLNLSVIRLLKQITMISETTATPVSLCGEIAGDPRYTMLLLGLGLRQFSMSHGSISQIKQVIRSVTITECKELADSIMNLELTSDIEKLVDAKFIEKFPVKPS